MDTYDLEGLDLNTEVDVEDDSSNTRTLRERKKKNGSYAENSTESPSELSRRERRKVTQKKNNYNTGKSHLRPDPKRNSNQWFDFRWKTRPLQQQRHSDRFQQRLVRLLD